MLRTRVLTALVLLLILATAAVISPQVLIALAAVFLGIVLAEWLRLSAVPARLAVPGAVMLAGAALALEMGGVRPAPRVLAGACVLACSAWMAIGFVLTMAQRGPVRMARSLLVAGALLLAGVAWLALVELLQRGITWTLSVLALVWLADIAAYFSGRAFGVRKLASRISPSKTWAGVWGAVLAVVVVAEAGRWLWPQGALWSTKLLLAAPGPGIAILLVFVAMSIIGDLFESLVKRQAGVKDSGTILPGHGGVWDRIDATLPVLPLAVLGHWYLVNGWNHA